MRYDIYLKGYVGGWDFDPDVVDWAVENFDGQPLTALIDSTGGSAAAGFAVQHAFRRHGDVTVHLKGYCASAATIAAMGARRITIDSTAFFLVHKASLPLDTFNRSFNADEFAAIMKDLEKAKAHLDDLDAVVAQQYARRCKKSTEALLALMAEERWLTPAEALEWGFVDAVVETDDTAELSPVEVRAMADGLLPKLPANHAEATSAEDNDGVTAGEHVAADDATSVADEAAEPGYVARIFAKLNALFDRLRPTPEGPASEQVVVEPVQAPAPPVREEAHAPAVPDDRPTRPVISTGATVSTSSFADSMARARALYDSLP